MKKDIYKKVPESFHMQLCQTLDQLEDAPGRIHIHSKRYVLILAAAILACASITAAAVGLMRWHERASVYFGTEKELEDQLTMKGAAVPQDAVVEENGLEFRAIQAVRTDQYDYFLLQMSVPETLEWNEDILFEEVDVNGPYGGCSASFVSGSLEDHTVLLEVQLYPDSDSSDTDEARIWLKNLVQTERSVVTDCLMEGEWEIPLVMPSSEADTVTFYPEQTLSLAGHELHITKVEISPFQLYLYTDMDEALHAVWGHRTGLAGVWYKDGTVVEEDGISLSMSGHQDETGSFCFKMPLEQAIDPTEIAGILIQDGTEECRYFLNPSKEAISGTDHVSTDRSELPVNGSMEDIRLLYVRYGNVVLSDGQSVYLWDALCGGGKELFSLEAYGFSGENGGEIAMGQASQILFLPYAGSEHVYLYDIAGQEMLELDAETFWPWPTYAEYLENVKDIKEVVPEADGRCSGQAFFSQGRMYYLYSENGTTKDMELRSVE